MVFVKIDLEIINKVLSYLAEKPFKESAQLISEIRSNAVVEKEEIPPVDTHKEVVAEAPEAKKEA